jgi:phospho-N-acetylmuramoyl-pentapeptide-transferase
MLLELLYPLSDEPGLGFLNVFRYITFRAAYAAVTALLISFFLGPPIVRWLGRIGIGQQIRDDGPESHHSKKGTPTMGGVLILIAIGVPTLLFGNLSNKSVEIALWATLFLGMVGFLDDYLRVVKNLRKGLLGRYKLAGQVTIGLLVAWTLMTFPSDQIPATITAVPFLKFQYLDLGWLYVPFVVLVITGSSNAVNLTDGLDGLASGLVALAGLTMGGFAYASGHVKISEYLNILHLPEAGELTVFCAALVGAALGFLWYNCHPADLFMGDTGSLALGGALGLVAVLIKRELIWALVGGVFVAETLSVMLQVGWFKISGKRLFRMAPLHHHFELLGWPESRVVIRLFIVGVLFSLVSLSTLKLQ